MPRLAIIMSSFFLSGCMNSVTHFWNNGFAMTKKESDAYHFCMDTTNMNKNYDEFYNCLKQQRY